MSDYFDPVFIAALEGNVDDLRTLLASGARPRDVYEIGDGKTATLLQLVAHSGACDVACLLLMHGVDVNKQDSSGMTALHTAAMQGNAEMAELLLQNGANPEVPEKNLQDTPLHVAARNGAKELVAVLLKHGANQEAKGKGGITPLLLASHGGHVEVAQLLSRGDIAGSLARHIRDARSRNA